MSITDQQFPATASGSTPDRRGQGTMVEQARAATEVQAQVYLAREFPRDTAAAKARMLEACAQIELAEAAFYSYPRSGETVSGLTIVAACELALIWGNIGFGLAELRRDDEYGQSEMNAYAWELETNTRIGSTFIVVHTRETKKGNYRLTESRDIYEKNTNEGNRRMRAAILKVLPRWYVLAAERALRRTLTAAVEQSRKPLAEQIREAAGHFEKRFGLTLAQIEQWGKRPVDRWQPEDLVRLQTLWRSLSHNEIRIEEAFPQAKVTAEEIAAGSAPAAPQREGEPLHGVALMRVLESAMRVCGSASDLEQVYAKAVEHRDAGNLSVDEFTQVEVAGSQRDRELAAVVEDEAHAEAVAQAWHGEGEGDD